MFGSDYPFYTDSQTAHALDRITENGTEAVTAEDIENIKNRNARAFLDKYVFAKTVR